MSDHATVMPAGDNLQFERAERANDAKPLSCAVCKQSIATTYYQINGHVTCLRCRNRVMGQRDRGSSSGRFLKALALGFGAALLGAGVYFGIAALTGYEFGLVAIVVGLLVGGAVRKGSNARGGWRYQALAMFLTYTAVVVTDSSIIARELGKELRVRRDSALAVVDTSQVFARPAATVVRPDTTPARQTGRPGLLALSLGLVVLVALAYVAPVLIGVSSPLHLLIAGFALYEAWKLNRRVELRIMGPYQVAAPPQVPA